MKNDFLIAFEGIDGSGKSTQCALLKLYLDRIYLPAVIVKSKQKNQDKIFNQFIKVFEINPESVSYMFLYQALHRKQYEQTKNAFDKGKVVIADRWNPSFFVYHSLFGPLSRKTGRLLRDIDRLAFENLRPRICFLLDVSVESAFNRRILRGDRTTFNDAERNFYQRINDEYKRIAKNKHWKIIDGEQSIEKIHCEVVGIVAERISENKIQEL